MRCRGRQGNDDGPARRSPVPGQARVFWTNLLNSQAAGDLAKAYGVEEIPAGFLIDRDGKIIAVEQSGDVLERAVVAALGSSAATPSK